MVVADPLWPAGAVAVVVVVVVVGAASVPPTGTELDGAGNDSVVVAPGLVVAGVVGLVDGVLVVDVTRGRATVVGAGTTGT